MSEQRIALGDRVKDKITKRTGIVTAITDWLYGCRRIQVQPEKPPKGKEEFEGSFVIDEPQAELVKKGVITGRHHALDADVRRHGDRGDVRALPATPSR